MAAIAGCFQDNTDKFDMDLRAALGRLAVLDNLYGEEFDNYTSRLRDGLIRSYPSRRQDAIVAIQDQIDVLRRGGPL